MIIIMERHASPEATEVVISFLKEYNLQPIPLFNGNQTVIVCSGDTEAISVKSILSLDKVERATKISAPYKLAAKSEDKQQTIIKLKNISIGGDQLALMAGPCSVESYEQMDTTAAAVKNAGANILRAGAFKPRTTPYSFQGLGEEGLEILRAIGDKYDMPVITEVLDTRDVQLVEKYTDIFQIGARNMQNFRLLETVGRTNTPVMLKRGPTATIKEMLLAAEYILSNGNMNVMFCERGIRTFEQETRNTLCLATVPIIKKLSHLPIIVDPSHGTGNPDYIPAMSFAAIAAGADGIMVEVHPNPPESVSDADQALSIPEFDDLVTKARPIIAAVNKTL